MEPLSLDDLRIIGKQLGREPRGVHMIETRCCYGYPQVISVRPLVDEAPFPTTFWLTCPHLKNEVDRLESDGWIQKVENELAANAVLRAGLKAATQAYRAERKNLLSRLDLRTVKGRGISAAVLGKGIGGTADTRRVKCLHMHVAHALARDNAVGTLILQEIAALCCSPRKVICSVL